MVSSVLGGRRQICSAPDSRARMKPCMMCHSFTASVLSDRYNTAAQYGSSLWPQQQGWLKQVPAYTLLRWCLGQQLQHLARS